MGHLLIGELTGPPAFKLVSDHSFIVHHPGVMPRAKGVKISGLHILPCYRHPTPHAGGPTRCSRHGTYGKLLVNQSGSVHPSQDATRRAGGHWQRNSWMTFGISALGPSPYERRSYGAGSRGRPCKSKPWSNPLTPET